MKNLLKIITALIFIFFQNQILAKNVTEGFERKYEILENSIINNKNTINDINSFMIPFESASLCKDQADIHQPVIFGIVLKSKIVSLFSINQKEKEKETIRLQKLLNVIKELGFIRAPVDPERAANDEKSIMYKLYRYTELHEHLYDSEIASAKDVYAQAKVITPSDDNITVDTNRVLAYRTTEPSVCIDNLDGIRDIMKKIVAINRLNFQDLLKIIEKLEINKDEILIKRTAAANDYMMVLARSNLKTKAIQEKIQNCQRTNPAYAYYAATSDIANSVINAQSLVRMFERAIAKEKEGAAISGYVDKKIMYESGQNLVRYIPQRDAAFRAYKNAGGRASSPAEVTNISNPCAIFE